VIRDGTEMAEEQSIRCETKPLMPGAQNNAVTGNKSQRLIEELPEGVSDQRGAEPDTRYERASDHCRKAYKAA